jgi:cyclase
MCDVTRRGFLVTGAAFLSAAAEAELLQAEPPAEPSAYQVEEVVPGVYFAKGDTEGRGVCNSGFVVFDDYVLAIDATYPAGARDLVRGIRAVTEKPIRFAFNTHHHGDHAYGNQVLVDSGATPVAHVGVVEEMRRYETGYYDDKPGRWEDEARERPDVRESRLKPPSVLFPKELYFDDGHRRVELVHLGVGHTHGDAVAWLPREGILFSGDACVNGAWNFVGDGEVAKWIKTLDTARGLNARVVCPGHGLRGTATLLEDQQLFFKTLWDKVGAQLSKLSPEEARGRVESLRAEIQTEPRIARYASGTSYDPFAEQVAKVYEEITGRRMRSSADLRHQGRERHARAHGRPPLRGRARRDSGAVAESAAATAKADVKYT